jgi:hypothetical protein
MAALLHQGIPKRLLQNPPALVSWKDLPAMLFSWSELLTKLNEHQIAMKHFDQLRLLFCLDDLS